MSIWRMKLYTWLRPAEVPNEKGFETSLAPRWKKGGSVASNAATRALECLVVIKPAVLQTWVANALGLSWKIVRWSCEEDRGNLWTSYMDVE